MTDNKVFRLVGQAQYEKHVIDSVGAEHVLVFTPDVNTGTVTVESELDGRHVFTKELKRENARLLWMMMVRNGYKRVLLWIIKIGDHTHMLMRLRG